MISREAWLIEADDRRRFQELIQQLNRLIASGKLGSSEWENLLREFEILGGRLAQGEEVRKYLQYFQDFQELVNVRGQRETVKQIKDLMELLGSNSLPPLPPEIEGKVFKALQYNFGSYGSRYPEMVPYFWSLAMKLRKVPVVNSEYTYASPLPISVQVKKVTRTIEDYSKWSDEGLKWEVLQEVTELAEQANSYGWRLYDEYAMEHLEIDRSSMVSRGDGTVEISGSTEFYWRTPKEEHEIEEDSWGDEDEENDSDWEEKRTLQDIEQEFRQQFSEPDELEFEVMDVAEYDETYEVNVKVDFTVGIVLQKSDEQVEESAVNTTLGQFASSVGTLGHSFDPEYHLQTEPEEDRGEAGVREVVTFYKFFDVYEEGDAKRLRQMAGR